MPQIGWFEILLIVVVSILVVGPKDFPVMLKKIGSWIGSIKKYFNELQSEVSLYEYENDEEKNLGKNKVSDTKDEK
jgi:sec-independent protein translocase protein TatB|tara:strand:- start:403 stop:630 length:228 start_codon:yes stop_codon:yes gene_type:complete